MKMIFALLLALPAALSCGCGGIQASKTISPLDFFLPGIMQNAPSKPPVPGVTNSAPLLAGSPDSFRPSGHPRALTGEPQNQLKE